MKREELKAIILRLAALHVAEMDSWKATHSNEARKCPTCGCFTIEPSKEKEEAHDAIYRRMEEAKLEAYDSLVAAGVGFGYHIPVSGEASSDLDHYTLEGQIKGYFKGMGLSMKGITLDSESGCFFAYCKNWECVDLLMEAIVTFDPTHGISAPDREKWKPYPEDIHMGLGSWSDSAEMLKNPAIIDEMIADVQGLTD